MLDAEWCVHEADGVTLVAAVVENTTRTAREVRLVSRLDGPVIPPRRRGVPEAGWSDRGFEGVVSPDGRLALGFACPGDATDPPIDVVDAGRAPDDDGAGGEDLPTPTDLVRTLGSPAPPRDAVPAAAADGAGVAVVDGEDATAGRHEDDGDATTGRDEDVGVPDNAPASEHAVGVDGTAPQDEPSVPSSVADWLDDVAEQVERAERLTAARDLDAAAAAIEETGGLAAVEELLSELADDEAALRAVADRATDLADACEVREAVPVDSYRELA